MIQFSKILSNCTVKFDDQCKCEAYILRGISILWHLQLPVTYYMAKNKVFSKKKKLTYTSYNSDSSGYVATQLFLLMRKIYCWELLA